MKIAILGYGTEGQAVAEYFIKQWKNKDITVCDREKKDIAKDIHTRFGTNYLENLKDFDVIFRSPGIPYLKKELSPVRKKLTSATKYFFERCQCQIVGVTGTKGKGTVATLIYKMAKEWFRVKGRGCRVFLGGNMGKPPIAFLDEIRPNDLVILELSSFQLQDLDKSPHIAVILGITPDHLDHHATFEEYIEAKKNIMRFQKAKDFAIVDFDNKISASFAKETKAQRLFCSLTQEVDSGAFLKVGSFILRQGKETWLFGEKGDTKLPGDHNIKNILIAATTANLLEVPVEIITKVVREFPGLPHRLEFLKEVDHVKYYDDSASTNPETTIAALHTFHEQLILIAGGSDKNIDFKPLGEEIAKRPNVKTLILMGQTKEKLSQSIEKAAMREEKRIAEITLRTGRPIRRRDIPLELISADTYQEAFMVARLVAQAGDIVLLSPACASLDMFSNYEERGMTFRNFVENL